jgi:ABC-type Fe3+/spermidine/putrescine transport system ATPase subunit
MHCMAGLDSAGSGQVVLDGTHLTELSGRALTRVRREEVGFLFQSFNLLPQLTALENIVLPLSLDGRSLDHDLLDHLVSVLGIGDRMSHRPGELSGASSSAWHWRALWWPGPPSSLPTNPPATWTRAPARRCWSSCAAPCATWTRP